MLMQFRLFTPRHRTLRIYGITVRMSVVIPPVMSVLFYLFTVLHCTLAVCYTVVGMTIIIFSAMSMSFCPLTA